MPIGKGSLERVAQSVNPKNDAAKSAVSDAKTALKTSGENAEVKEATQKPSKTSAATKKVKAENVEKLSNVKKESLDNVQSDVKTAKVFVKTADKNIIQLNEELPVYLL